MDNPLGKPIDNTVDGENIPVHFDFAYPLRGSLSAAMKSLRERHGDKLYLLPISGSSCGGGVMQVQAPGDGKIIGLRFDPPVEPRIRNREDVNLGNMAQNEIALDTARKRVMVGSAITLAQLNQVLQDQLGPAYRVPGADLTSYQYAAVGATFMTGGMGPQRRYFSDSVSAAAIFDGQSIRIIEGEELNAYAGTYGWSGLITAVECQYYEFPPVEVAFSLPVSDEPIALASLLARLAPFCDWQLESGNVCNRNGKRDLLLGIEHVSVESMQPLLAQAQSGSTGRRALSLQQKCEQSSAAGLLFINGLCTGSADEFLMELVDDCNADEPSIADIALEHAEMFTVPDEMRDLREAIPYAARMQTPAYRHLYKNHSDAVIRIHPGNETEVMTELWQINRKYVVAVRKLFAEQNDIEGNILVYGHLNPQGVDPHNRVTMGCDDRETFEQTREKLSALRAQYYCAMADLCAKGNASFVGGEKTADSEREILAAFGGVENAPENLRLRCQQQQMAVKRAAPMFNWRALPPYR